MERRKVKDDDDVFRLSLELRMVLSLSCQNTDRKLEKWCPDENYHFLLDPQSSQSVVLFFMDWDTEKERERD